MSMAATTPAIANRALPATFPAPEAGVVESERGAVTVTVDWSPVPAEKPPSSGVSGVEEGSEEEEIEEGEAPMALVREAEEDPEANPVAEAKAELMALEADPVAEATALPDDPEDPDPYPDPALVHKASKSSEDRRLRSARRKQNGSPKEQRTVGVLDSTITDTSSTDLHSPDWGSPACALADGDVAEVVVNAILLGEGQVSQHSVSFMAAGASRGLTVTS
jgi:hypothetical protein